MSDFLDKAKDMASDLAEKAKDVAGDVAEKAGDLADSAKDKVSELAHEHGHKVTGAVEKGTDFVDDKTGGKIAPVTDKVDELTNKAVEAAKGGGSADSAGDAAPPAAQ